MQQRFGDRTLATTCGALHILYSTVALLPESIARIVLYNAVQYRTVQSSTVRESASMRQRRTASRGPVERVFAVYSGCGHRGCGTSHTHYSHRRGASHLSMAVRIEEVCRAYRSSRRRRDATPQRRGGRRRRRKGGTTRSDRSG